MNSPSSSYATILDSNSFKGGRRSSHMGARERFTASRESLELICVYVWMWLLEGEREKGQRGMLSPGVTNTHEFNSLKTFHIHYFS